MQSQATALLLLLLPLVQIQLQVLQHLFLLSFNCDEDGECRLIYLYKEVVCQLTKNHFSEPPQQHHQCCYCKFGLAVSRKGHALLGIVFGNRNTTLADQVLLYSKARVFFCSWWLVGWFTVKSVYIFSTKAARHLCCRGTVC